MLRDPVCTAQYWDWFMRADPGDVFFVPRGPYTSAILHSFVNAPSTTHFLTAGTTHVAVGFLDLGQLSCIRVVPGAKDRASEAPVQWIGYDSSAYSVAKYLVRTTSNVALLAICRVCHTFRRNHTGY